MEIGSGKSKFMFAFLFVFLMCAWNACAVGSGITVLDTASVRILGLLKSPVVKLVFVGAIIICAGVGAWGYSQGASGLVKGMIVIIFAMCLALSAPSIVNYFSNGVEIESLTTKLMRFENPVFYS